MRAAGSGTVMRVVIVDDEELARRRTRATLQHRGDVEVVGEAASIAEAAALIRAATPDLVLLDVGLPGETGFDLLPMLDGPAVPLVIFVTAFQHFAVRAFEEAAVDYVLKPVASERLFAALDRAKADLQRRDAEVRVQEMRAVIAALRTHQATEQVVPAHDGEFWVQHRNGYVRVPVSRIEWVEAERDYVRLHTGDGSYLMRETMSQMEERLDPRIFVRVHRSAFVRRSLIEGIRAGNYGRRKLSLSNGAEVPVGRTYTQVVRDLINGGRIS